MLKIKNTTDADVTIAEIIEKITTLAAGEELEVNPDTTTVEIR